MENDRDKLVKIFEKLDPENQANLLAHVQIAYVAQENAKKHFKRIGPSNPSYSMPSSGPLMAKALAEEALNG